MADYAGPMEDALKTAWKLANGDEVVSSAQGLEAFSREFCEREGFKPKELFTLIRIGISGRTAAPPLFDTMAVMGKDRCRLRLRDTLAFLKAEPDW